MEDHWIPDDDWRTIVANVPTVSVDLVIRRDGGVLLRRRTNEPAKGYWFVPGGRVLKGETRREAVHRVAEEELDIEVEIVESFGAFEYLYENSELMVSIRSIISQPAILLTWLTDNSLWKTSMMRSECFWSPPDPFHEYVQAYVEAASMVTQWTKQIFG